MTVEKVITTEQMAKYRTELADNSDAISALDVIEECKGNLQDAWILMAMRETGKEADRGFNIEELAEQCRPVICSEKTKKVLKLINILTACLAFPVTLVVLVVLFIVEDIGLENFCKNFESES